MRIIKVDRNAFTDEAIQRVVRSFYARVADDELIGPVFASRVSDWEPHLARMTDFWATVLRGESRFKPAAEGSPKIIHRGISQLDHAHFVRWLSLFSEVTYEELPIASAEFMIERAQQMAGGLSSHLRAGVPYKQLRFDVGAIPEGLKREHTLKAGVWARLYVEEGKLLFVSGAARRALSRGDVVLIDSRPHHLEQADAAAIAIDFYRTQN